MFVTVLTWMRNEADLVPFFLRHYAFADRIVAWDNESTDGTRELLAKDPRVELRTWVTGGVMRDLELTEMKSSVYLQQPQGWNFIVDADEFIWHPDMRGLLGEYDRIRVSIATTAGFDMVSDGMPIDDGKTPLVDLVKDGVPNKAYSKFVVIRSDAVVKFGHGAHLCNGVGGWCLLSQNADMKLLHYRFLGLDRVLRKAQEYVQSEENKAAGLGWDNCNPVLMGQRWAENYAKRTRVI